MGVFTTSKAYRLGLNLSNPWWLSGASIDLDFDNQRYYDSSLGAGVQSLAPVNSYLSISRASTKYAKTADGTLQSFANDTLAITSLGLSVEDARTNIVTRSQELGDATWGGSNLTITADQAVAPDGTTTMDKLDDATASGQHRILQLVTISTNTTYTASVFLKNIDRRYVQLRWNGSSSGSSVYAYADLQTGTISDSGLNAPATGAVFTSASIEAFGNGIYRLSVTGIVSSSADTGAYMILVLSDVSSGGGAPNYTGSNKSVYAWGAQVEQASFASSYIPTTGASATRAQDLVTLAGAADTIVKAIPYSALFDGVGISTYPMADHALLYGKEGSNPQLFRPNTPNNQVLWNGSVNATLGNSLTWLTGVKVATGLGSGATSLVAGGGTVVTDSSTQTMSGTVRLGSQSGGSPTSFWGYIRRFTLWNSKLADATLQSLTAP